MISKRTTIPVPDSPYRHLYKLVLPSIFDTSLSSLMTWNLLSYSTTVLNERLWYFNGGRSKRTQTPPKYFHHFFYLLKLCQYTGDSTMIQFVSKTYQAHTSTDGSLVVRPNKHRIIWWYNINKKLSWSWQARETRLVVSQGHQT